MIQAGDFKKGDIVTVDGEPHVIESIFVQKPAARGTGTLYKVRFRSLATKRKIDRVFRRDDGLQEADFERHPIQVLYGDSESVTFMDLQDYSQFTLTKGDIEDEWFYLTEGLDGLASLISEGRVIGIALPLHVSMKIVETRPSVKGGSVTARTKPATLATGLVVQVPEYMAEGEVIRVDTRTGLFLSKA
jgi:elongation factor P